MTCFISRSDSRCSGSNTSSRIHNSIWAAEDNGVETSVAQSVSLAYLHIQIVAAVNALSSQAPSNGTGRQGRLVTVSCLTDRATSIPWLSIGLEYAAIVAISVAVTGGAAIPVLAVVSAVGQWCCSSHRLLGEPNVRIRS